MVKARTDGQPAAPVQKSLDEVMDLEPEQARAYVHELAGKQLVKAAGVFDTIRSFPNQYLGYNQANYSRFSGREDFCRTEVLPPWVVLPARDFKSNLQKTPLLRRPAVRLTFLYDNDKAEQLGLDQMQKVSPTPPPDEVFVDIHAIALPPEAGRPNYNVYEDYNKTVSDQEIDLYYGDISYYFPDRHHTIGGESEMQNWDVFQSYPHEAINMTMIEHHYAKIANFSNWLGQITTALEDPELNPR